MKKKEDKEKFVHFNTTAAMHVLYGVDDFGNQISGGLLPYEVFMARYNYFHEGAK